MLRRLLAGAFLGACVTCLSTVASRAASPIGEWTVQDQDARIAIRTCGPNLCGKITWTSDGQDIGLTILRDMAPAGPRWTGTILDPRDKKTYLGHLSIQSETALKLDGCVMNGAICGGEIWTRYK